MIVFDAAVILAVVAVAFSAGFVAGIAWARSIA